MKQPGHNQPRRAAAPFPLSGIVTVALLVGLAMMVAGCQSPPKDREQPVVVVNPPDTSAAQNEPGENVPDSFVHNNTAGSAKGVSPRTHVDSLDNPSTWFKTIDADFNLARKLVEEELQVDLQHITLALVDDAPINSEVAFETLRLIKNQFGASTFAEQFLNQVMDPLSGTYAALYSSRLASVMISRTMLENYERSVASSVDDPSDRAALLTLLIHELVHAADDLRYRIHDNRALSFRASFAQSATFEGHAQWVTRRICEKAGCIQGLKALDDFMFNTDITNRQLTQPVEAISRNVLEYSYVEGERFIAGLAERANGDQLIDDLLRSPPADPIQILSPQTYPDVPRELRNKQLINAGRNVDHPWAESPWISVETSPLKGVDLRADPVRRQAAVDGFTRLIEAMIAMQFYDQRALNALPIEATILKAESPHTADLFASMMHSNTQQAGAHVSDEPLSINPISAEIARSPIQMHIYRTTIDSDISYRTAIAVSGRHVVQVSGDTVEQALLDDYAIRVLLKLAET